MDVFGDDSLFDVFEETHETVSQPKRPLDDNNIKDVLDKANSIAERYKKKQQSNSEGDEIVTLEQGIPSIPPSSSSQNVINTTIVSDMSTQIDTDNDNDLFDGYYPQEVVGSDTVEKNIVDPTIKSCAMQTCYPPRFDIDKYRTEWDAMPPVTEPAKTYPFTLDPFQANAVDCIEHNQSVLVAAHTSAGKTVVAEYAIATSLRKGRRVIYTSPIKALSNQKYGELKREFKDVGLLTGDVKTNDQALCLVMTTEILRNMLYNNSEILSTVDWIIFDEVHYMRDRSRGVVWEETIIMLPDTIRFVFLSATIPNAAEFALWVAKLHKQPCSIVYTDYRPTPLEHHVFAPGSQGLHLILDKKGQFRESNFQTALASLDKNDYDTEGAGEQASGVTASSQKKKQSNKNSTAEADVEKIVKTIKEMKLDPCIVFSFSKKECERYAQVMMKIDFSSDDERAMTRKIFTNALAGLSEEDRDLPQVQALKPLLERGIGIHHGGLIPILKEVVELLFQYGFLKVLFSTETFSIGLNMPARCVVFTSIMKFDGINQRALTSGEYIQMSGRAGRRGLDDRGVVILMLNQQIEANVIKEMVTGKADPLLSSFHLSYNMLLNLTRRKETKDPSYLMARSFYQFQQQRCIPLLSNVENALIEQRTSIATQLTEILRLIKKGTPLYHIMDNPQFNLNDDHNTTNTTTKTTSSLNKKKKDKQATSSTAVSNTTLCPDITFNDLQRYYAQLQNLDGLRYKLRRVIHQTELIKPFLTPCRVVKVKGITRIQQPPLPGSAAALSLQLSYNNPIDVDNNLSYHIKPLKFNDTVLDSLQQLRHQQRVLNGNNLNNNTNSDATTSQISNDKNIEGLTPPGFDLEAQLTPGDKAMENKIIAPALIKQEVDWGWGIIVNTSMKTLPQWCLHGASTPLPPPRPTSHASNKEAAVNVFILDILLACDPDTVDSQYVYKTTKTVKDIASLYGLTSLLRPCPKHKKPIWVIVPVTISALNGISPIRASDSQCTTPDMRQLTGDKLTEIITRYPSKSPDDYNTDGYLTTYPYVDTQLPLLDPVQQLQIKHEAVITLLERIKQAYNKVIQHRIYTHPLKYQLLTLYIHLLHCDGYLKWLNCKKRNVSRDYELSQTLSNMSRVLRRLGMVGDDHIMTNKGAIACELSTCDELVGTQLFFNGTIQSWQPAEICALLSCLVFDEPAHEDKIKIPEGLQSKHTELLETARSIALTVEECGVSIDKQKFEQRFNPMMMESVYEWCNGSSFSSICKKKIAFEGTVIRVMRRLEELLRQFAQAASKVDAQTNQDDMEEKFNTCGNLMKRGIVFAASLYTNEDDTK